MWKTYIDKLSDFPELTSLWEIEMTDEIKSVVPKAKNVLEVGCSNGRWIRWFCREYGCGCYGIDNSNEGFKKRDMNFVFGDAFNLPFADGSFELVFSKGFIEHFKNSDDFSLLKEQVRVLKRGGYLICEVPNLALSLEYLYVKYFYDIRRGYRHYIKTHTQIMRYFKSLGIKIISCKFLGWFWLLQRFRIPKLSNCSLTSQEYMIIGIKSDCDG